MNCKLNNGERQTLLSQKNHERVQSVACILYTYSKGKHKLSASKKQTTRCGSITSTLPPPHPCRVPRKSHPIQRRIIQPRKLSIACQPAADSSPKAHTFKVSTKNLTCLLWAAPWSCSYHARSSASASMQKNQLREKKLISEYRLHVCICNIWVGCMVNS